MNNMLIPSKFNNVLEMFTFFYGLKKIQMLIYTGGRYYSFAPGKNMFNMR